MSYKRHYSRFLKGLGGRLHFAAHSHYPWPDRTREAALACWDDAAERIDAKWGRTLGPVLAAAQRSVAASIGLPDPSCIAFAPNTHELVVRLLSCLPPNRPPRILTSDSEFHSFARQAARLEEDGARVVRVPVEPFDSFVPRLVKEAKSGAYDMVFVSQVFFNSGLRLRDEALETIATAAGKALVAFDGYHAFMAVPMNLGRAARRAFYLAGGYKYAQAGEGACFLAVPPGCKLRPANTGWFADIAALEGGIKAPVGYGEGAYRFWGSTFDASGLYRLNAVYAWRKSLRLSVAKSDAYVRALQRSFIRGLKPGGTLGAEALVSTDLARVGHFLTFRTPRAGALKEALAKKGVLVDSRGDRLRFGFGLYQDEGDLDRLQARLAKS